MIKRVITIIYLLSLISSICSCSAFKLKESSLNSNMKNSLETIYDKGPIKGGVLNLFSTPPDTLNPLFTTNMYVKNFLEISFESLVSFGQNHTVVPCLAKSWTVSPDGLVWTFYLREKVFWHDGIPFTADDIEFTLTSILDKNSQSIYKSNLQNISSFSMVNSKTFQVTLKNPNSFTAELMHFPVIPKHYFLNENIFSSPRNMSPVGTGPFMFLKYDKIKNQLIFKRNNKWWKSVKSNNISTPYIEEISIKIYPNSSLKTISFLSDETNVINVDKNDLAKFYKRSDLTVKKYPSENFDFLAFNLANQTLSNKSLRQAISYAINKNDVILSAIPGMAIASHLPIPPDSWILGANKEQSMFNINKSKQLLLQSGYIDKDGFMYKRIGTKLKKLSLEIATNMDNPTRVKAAENIKAQLNHIGIDLKVVPITWDKLSQKISSGQFEIVLTGCTTPLYPDISFMYSDSNLNINRYNNSYVSKLLRDLYTSENIDKKTSIFSEVRNILNDDMPYIGLYFYNKGVVYNKKVRGQLDPNIWLEYNDISKWYVLIM